MNEYWDPWPKYKTTQTKDTSEFNLYQIQSYTCVLVLSKAIGSYYFPDRQCWLERVAVTENNPPFFYLLTHV